MAVRIFYIPSKVYRRSLVKTTTNVELALGSANRTSNKAEIKKGNKLSKSERKISLGLRVGSPGVQFLN